MSSVFHRTTNQAQGGQVTGLKTGKYNATAGGPALTLSLSF